MKLAYQSSLVLAAMLAIPGIGFAKEKAPPPTQPETEPDWGQVRRESEARLKSSLFDPGSAQIEWLSGFRWGYYKPLLQKKVWGWVGCGSINAKNRLGGYVGASAFVVVYNYNVQYQEIDDKYGLVAASCSQMGYQPMQAAFTDVPATPSGGGSVADELSKLATLRDKGIISQAEFNAQKAKLLAR